MARKKSGVSAVVSIFFVLFICVTFITGSIIIAIIVVVVIIGIGVALVFAAKPHRAQTMRNVYSDQASYHFSEAQKAEQGQDFLRARMEYLKCVEGLKQIGDIRGLEDANKCYEDFVRRDPIFNQLSESLYPLIKDNPGIMQSEITKQFESQDWSKLYKYQRQIAKDDIYYALYFMDKFAIITRKKKGRSYELLAL